MPASHQENRGLKVSTFDVVGIVEFGFRPGSSSCWGSRSAAKNWREAFKGPNEINQIARALELMVWLPSLTRFELLQPETRPARTTRSAVRSITSAQD